MNAQSIITHNRYSIGETPISTDPFVFPLAIIRGVEVRLSQSAKHLVAKCHSYRQVTDDWNRIIAMILQVAVTLILRHLERLPCIIVPGRGEVADAS